MMLFLYGNSITLFPIWANLFKEIKLLNLNTRHSFTAILTRLCGFLYLCGQFYTGGLDKLANKLMLGLLFSILFLRPKLIWHEAIPEVRENNKEASQLVTGWTGFCRCHKQQSWRGLPKQAVTTENKIVNKSFGTLDSIWFFTYLPTATPSKLYLSFPSCRQ